MKFRNAIIVSLFLGLLGANTMATGMRDSVDRLKFITVQRKQIPDLEKKKEESWGKVLATQSAADAEMEELNKRFAAWQASPNNPDLEKAYEDQNQIHEDLATKATAAMGVFSGFVSQIAKINAARF